MSGFTFFILGASATVPSRLTNASPPFCCGSGRFIADDCGIFTGFGVSKPGLGSAFTEGSIVGVVAEEPAFILPGHVISYRRGRQNLSGKAKAPPLKL
jgi:hypothetical protein